MLTDLTSELKSDRIAHDRISENTLVIESETSNDSDFIATSHRIGRIEATTNSRFENDNIEIISCENRTRERE